MERTGPVGSGRSSGIPTNLQPMATLRLFAAAREAAGTGQTRVAGTTVADVLAGAVASFGPQFQTVLQSCRIWVNGEQAEPDTAVADNDEVAVLPPVSGGFE
ncbi:MAG: hypothetical protein RLZ14_728 [Actinomycetota bacterium]